jgi:hypothetical protein
VNQIFISYRRQDTSFFAARLRDRLEQSFPGQVFLDVSGIEAGADFLDRLKSAVLSSKVVIAAIGPAWAADRPGRPRLGEDGDVLTEELVAALEARIPIIPVLMDHARMPADLPPRLQPLLRLNTISVSHERFDSDAGHLVAAVYKPLGIAPPDRLERMLELVGRTSFNHRTRDLYAMWSVAATMLALLSAVQWFIVSERDPLELPNTLLLAAAALGLAALGRNSIRRRRLALASIAVAAATLLGSVGLGVQRGVTLPIDPWFAAMETAQEHVGRPELPADRISWSTRALFTVPLPTVECDCLEIGNRLSGPVPYGRGSVFSFTNGCKGPVTLALARSRTALGTAAPWFAGLGRDFAVVTLSPGQRVGVPMEGTFGGAYQPWICMKAGLPVD